MIPINYPNDRNKFNTDYIEQLKISDHKRRLINRYFGGTRFSSLNFNLDELLVGEFDVLLNFRERLDSITVTDSELKSMSKLFNYDKSYSTSYRDNISTFFYSHRDSLNLKTCYFCNIDFVNGFSDIDDYHNSLDFVKRAPIIDLIKVKCVGISTANKIFSQRGSINSIDDLDIRKDSKDSLKNMDISSTQNHFTLDHVLDKSTYPIFSLCLYNLVPSCYSCNCKFKGSKDILNGGNLSSLSPTSSDFNLNDVLRFRVLFHNRKSIHTAKSSKDFLIDLGHHNQDIDHYRRMFKLVGRYTFHKDEIVELIDKKRKYSDSKILELSRQLKVPVADLRKDIFGRELFEGSLEDKSLTKFKRDIAKNIGIKGVK